MLDSNDTLENFLRFRIPRRRRYDTRTIDEVNPSHQGDVLPNFGFSWNRCGFANCLLLESVDDRRFTDVGVSDESDRDLFLVGEEGRELTEKLNEGTFSERIVDRGVESDGRVRFRQDFDPSSLAI